MSRRFYAYRQSKKSTENWDDEGVDLVKEEIEPAIDSGQSFSETVDAIQSTLAASHQGVENVVDVYYAWEHDPETGAWVRVCYSEAAFTVPLDSNPGDPVIVELLERRVL